MFILFMKRSPHPLMASLYVMAKGHYSVLWYIMALYVSSIPGYLSYAIYNYVIVKINELENEQMANFNS